MAADTVSAFTSVSFGLDECQIKGIDSEDHGIEYKSSYHQNTKRYGMPLDELESSKEREHFHTRNRKGREIEDTFKENSSDLNNTMTNGIDSKYDMEFKKKRNSRKRNRSDMSPEELRRLRERERKAQQSRRDRIRAQKRQNQGWHDDDAAWEAFLDQAEENKSVNKSSKKHHSTSIPSMVCQIESNHLKTEGVNNNEKDEVIPFDDESELERHITEKQDIQDTESNTSSFIENQSQMYSSDDSNHGSAKDSKKLSRRHYLPSEELEKLRKRERDAKRKQRERYRQASLDNGGQEKSASDVESQPDVMTFNKIDDCMKTEEKQINHGEKTHKNEPELEHEQYQGRDCDRGEECDQQHRDEDHSEQDEGKSPHHRRHVRSHGSASSLLISPPLHPHYAHNAFHKPLSSPHSHHSNDFYSPLIYMPENRHHRHPYSPTEKHFIPDVRHHHESSHHEEIYDRHSRGHHQSKQHHYPSHFTPITHSQNHSENVSPPVHDSQKSKNSGTTSPHCEKKKMISRNVDRKKLSEEELEELRRRERDYQRERRARIRLEKAKTQAQQERFQHKGRENLPENYYHATQMYHPHHIHRHHDKIHSHPDERSMDVISRYELQDHYEYRERERSPRCLKTEQILKDEESLLQNHTKVLQLTIPTYKNSEEDIEKNSKESDLLQVVPKNRECEENELSPTATSFPVKEGKKMKKSILETICSSLKKEAVEWADTDEDKLVVHLKEEKMENEIKEETDVDKTQDSVESEENLAKLKEELLLSNDYSVLGRNSEEHKLSRDKITEDQLERRRRSNREAQRRRRARLKMQGNLEEQPDSIEVSTENSDFEKEKQLHREVEDRQNRKGCHLKVQPPRPDSLYMYHDLYPHRNAYHKERHHEFIHDKYGHYLPDPYFNSKQPHMYYPQLPSHHRVRDVDDSPRQHYYHEPAYPPREQYVHDIHPMHYHHRPLHHDKKERNHQHHSPSVPVSESHNCNNKVLPTTENVKPKKSALSSPLTKTILENGNDSKDDSFSEGNDEPISKSGRKRKQCAPRRVMTSASTTPEENIVAEPNCVVILSGTENSYEIEEPIEKHCLSENVDSLNAENNLSENLE